MKPPVASLPKPPRRLGRTVLLAAYLLLGGAALVVVLLLHEPAASVRFEPVGANIAMSLDGGSRVVLAPNVGVRLSAPGGVFESPAAELAPDYLPPARDAETRRFWWAERDRLRALATSGPMLLEVSAPPTAIPIRPRPRRLSDLSVDVWLLLFQSVSVGLIGVWLLSLLPRDGAARLFALACAGVSAAGYTGALFDGRDLLAGGAWPRAMVAANLAACCVCSVALTGLFLVQPRRLILPAPALIAALASAAWGAGAVLGWLPLWAFYAGLAVCTVGLGAAILLQWRLARGRPDDRAVLRYVGAVALAGSVWLVGAMATPVLFGVQPIGSDGMAVFPVLLVFTGIAFGVRRTHLFELDRWTFRVLLGVLSAVALLGLDALLVWSLSLSGAQALAVALIAVGGLYPPLREALRRRLSGAPAPSGGELFSAATEVAFTADPEKRRDRWRALLQCLFDPLQIENETDVPRAEIAQEGRVLRAPAAAGSPALRLIDRSQGRRLFHMEDVTVARELARLMSQAEASREAYRRGVLEERERIAQDLHDDVSARLLTSLHRTDAGEIHSDIRKAMSDIRAMVASLVGRAEHLDSVLAELRFEAAERLGAAGIELDWPLSPETGHQLEAREAKAISSSMREVVSNVIRHAGATRLSVQAAIGSGRLRLAATDNGSGAVDLDFLKVGGGLSNLRHRLRQIGGDADVSAGGGGVGVSVRLDLPLGWPE